MADWEWVKRDKRYRHTATGKFISAAGIAKLRDAFTQATADEMAAHTGRLIDGKLNAASWLRKMRATVRAATFGQFMFGRGGKQAMTPADTKLAETLTREQFVFLQGFAENLKSGALTDAQARARARLYAAAGRGMYVRGELAAYGITLPQHPGDGQTACRVNCKCHLTYEQAEGEVRVRWVLGEGEHCDDCVRLAGAWGPLVVAVAD